MMPLLTSLTIARLRPVVAALWLAAALPTAPVWAQSSASRAANPAEAAIRQALMTQFDKPDARLSVTPVAVVGNHAVAGWLQAGRGGRALLRQHAGQWQVLACGGDGLKDAQALQDAGLSQADAQRLSHQLAQAEARLPASTLAQLASFGQTLRLDGGGHHPAPATTASAAAGAHHRH